VALGAPSPMITQDLAPSAVPDPSAIIENRSEKPRLP
jgi:hypothetical protein